MKHKSTPTFTGFCAIGVLSLLLVFASACRPEETETVTPTNTVLDAVSSDPNFSVLAAAIRRARLEPAFNQFLPYTVFAPNNAAFQAAGFTEASIGQADSATVTAIVRYHILANRYQAASFRSSSDSAANTVNTNGRLMWMSVVNGGPFINGTSGARITQPNAVVASNGVIHGIDRVLTPPTRSIVETVANDPNFSILRVALRTAGLIDAVNSGTYTVFAPNNAAFQSAGIADTNAVKTVPNLADILRYHLSRSGRVFFSTDLANGPVRTSLVRGTTANPVNVPITIATSASGATVTDGRSNVANITRADLVTTNGSIHVINRVLLPPP